MFLTPIISTPKIYESEMVGGGIKRNKYDVKKRFQLKLLS